MASKNKTYTNVQQNALNTFKTSNYNQQQGVTNKLNQANKYSTYKQTDTTKQYQKAYDNMVNQGTPMWNGGDYAQNVKDTANAIGNTAAFSYDVMSDPLFQQYQQTYMRQGQQAMKNTLAQVGGYGSSYGTQVATQAYQNYAGQLNDKVPELYQAAYDRYNQDLQNQYNKLSMYQDLYNTQYGENRDNVSDYYQNISVLSDRLNNQRNFDQATQQQNYTNLYGQYQDRRDFQYQKTQDQNNQAYQWANAASGVDQYNQSLAWDKELQLKQLAETIRHNKETEAISKKNSGSGSGGGSGNGNRNKNSSSDSSSGNDDNTTTEDKRKKASKPSNY